LGTCFFNPINDISKMINRLIRAPSCKINLTNGNSMEFGNRHTSKVRHDFEGDNFLTSLHFFFFFFSYFYFTFSLIIRFHLASLYNLLELKLELN
jgi:hypothetical protein